MTNTTQTVDERCAELANNGTELCRFIWNAKDFLTMRWRLEHFGLHVVSAANRIIAERERESVALRTAEAAREVQS